MVEGRGVQAEAVERPGQTDDDETSIGWKWAIERGEVTQQDGGQGGAALVSEDQQGAPRETGRRGTVYKGQGEATVNRVGARRTSALAQSSCPVSRREDSGQVRRKR